MLDLLTGMHNMQIGVSRNLSPFTLNPPCVHRLRETHKMTLTLILPQTVWSPSVCNTYIFCEAQGERGLEAHYNIPSLSLRWHY